MTCRSILKKFSRNFITATGFANIRWVAFWTSLDENIIFSQVGEVRPAFPTVEIDLTDPLVADTDGLLDGVFRASPPR